jgi:hypothetical protein
LSNGGEWNAFFAGHCYLVDDTSFIAFQNKEKMVLMTIHDKKWSLPNGNASGKVVFGIDQLNITFDVDGNNDVNNIAFAPKPEALAQMFDAMSTGSKLTITVGRSAPRHFSLIGSKEPIEAFRKCVGIDAKSSNPFE